MNSNSNIISGLKLKHFVAVFCVFLLLAYTIQIIIDIERNRINQSLRSLVTEEATARIVKLESELNSNVYLVNGLIAYIYTQEELEETNVQIALKALYEFGTHVRNVGVAPDNRLTYVYPVEGNEAALGMYYPDNPQQWPAVEEAINARQTLLAGPLQLVQGGLGLISRTPVYLGDDSYWGILSLVLDADALFQSAGISPESEHLKLALRKIDPLNGETEVFIGDSALFSSDSVLVSIQVPGGTWQMAAEPIAGWGSLQDHLITIQSIALIMALFFVLSILINLRDQHRIESSRKRLETILNTTHDGVIVFNDLGRVTEANKAAELLFGYSIKEIQNLEINLLLEHENEHNTKKTKNIQLTDLLRVKNSTTLIARKQNGESFPVEISVGKTAIDRKTYYISTLKNISERKDAETKLRLLATTDSLTNTLNRRAIMDVGEQAFALARRHNRALSVMMIDADYFKKINDNFGHDCGDKILIAITKTIQQVLRTSDFCGRFGGEEFIVILPETDLPGAEVVASRLLDEIREIRVSSQNKEDVSVTVSIGVSEIHETSRQLTDIIQEADKALYEAKQSGRNRLICKQRPRKTPPNNLVSIKPQPVSTFGGR